MATENDIFYIHLIINGNSNAFGVLVDRYKDLVFSLALRMVKNREEAEEVSQDTFIKVFKSLSQFKGDSKFSTWIYKVTYNTSLDRLKKHKRQQPLVSIDDFHSNQIKSLDNALDNMENDERAQAINDCIKMLPSDEAFLLTLFYFDEQSLDEIAKIMGLTSNHVKVKLFRTRKKLTTILKKRLEPDIIECYEKNGY